MDAASPLCRTSCLVEMNSSIFMFVPWRAGVELSNACYSMAISNLLLVRIPRT